MKKIILVSVIVLLLACLLAIVMWFDVPRAENRVQKDGVTVIAKNLNTPWALAFLPSGELFVTERAGTVRLIDVNGVLQDEPVAQIASALETGEGGLLGIALHPEFSENGFAYLYYTYLSTGEDTLNRVVRMTYRDSKLHDEEAMVDGIPGNSRHNGGRIAFGPDGYLYVTTGDAASPSLSQDTQSFAGKILRVTDEGVPAPGNPFGNAVYSYGHRNPQGITWDADGQLWSTEHGRSGLASGFDELNLILPGRNYGWPTIQGDEVADGMETSLAHSGASTTWAPAGAAYLDGAVYFVGLRGQALYKATIGDSGVVITEHLSSEFGRLRDVILGPDGALYITTSNRDGRGAPKAADDRVIRISPDTIDAL